MGLPIRYAGGHAVTWKNTVAEGGLKFALANAPVDVYYIGVTPALKTRYSVNLTRKGPSSKRL
jgi:hypothetical protein